jgi:UDP-N-acetyl-D-glucosamine dehydrogenase
VDDDRESPSYEIIEGLAEHGADVSYCDPYFPVAKKTRKHDLGMESVALTPQGFAGYDAIVVATAHEAFANASLYRDARLVVDARNLMARVAGLPLGLRIVKA